MTNLKTQDPTLFEAIELELGRQRDKIELIASENFVSEAVMEAQGSVLTNKYAEATLADVITGVVNMWILLKISPVIVQRNYLMHIM